MINKYVNIRNPPPQIIKILIIEIFEIDSKPSCELGVTRCTCIYATVIKLRTMKLNVRADEYSSAPPIKSPKQRAISPIELSLLDCPRPWYTVNTDFFVV